FCRCRSQSALCISGIGWVLNLIVRVIEVSLLSGAERCLVLDIVRGIDRSRSRRGDVCIGWGDAGAVARIVQVLLGKIREAGIIPTVKSIVGILGTSRTHATGAQIKR